tara:strand:+ start:2382 stop:2699 length:318 start_codon:yes stop_codon:yes gene_type:complete
VASIKINKRQVQGLFDDIEKLPAHVLEKGFDFFKKITPIDSGNARRKTELKQSKSFSSRDNKIHANYGYAQRLDTGWSKQARKGMTGPTSDKMQDIADEYVRKEF